MEKYFNIMSTVAKSSEQSHSASVMKVLLTSKPPYPGSLFVHTNRHRHTNTLNRFIHTRADTKEHTHPIMAARVTRRVLLTRSLGYKAWIRFKHNLAVMYPQCTAKQAHCESESAALLCNIDMGDVDRIRTKRNNLSVLSATYKLLI